MSQRRRLLSALAVLSLGATPVLADGQTSPGSEQVADAPLDLAGLSRLAALLGPGDAALAERLRDCLDDLQAAEGELQPAADAVWRNAREMECAAALQIAEARGEPPEIY